MKQRRDEYGKRDYALFLLLYQSGLRVSEALSLKIEDVNFQNQTIRIFGKGQVESIIPFSTQTKNALRAYLRMRSDKSDKSYLFLSYRKSKLGYRYRKSKLGYRQVNTLLKEYAKQAGVEDITPHSLRHNFCLHLLASGRNLREIQQLARHKSIQSTVRYLSLSSEQTIKAYRQSEETLEI